MRKIEIDLRDFESIEEMHDRIAAAMAFPSYYGRNLDALYDCLTDIAEDTCVAVYGPADEERADFARRVQLTFEDAEEENDHLCAFFFMPEKPQALRSTNPFDPNFVPDPDDAELMGWYGTDDYEEGTEEE